MPLLKKAPPHEKVAFALGKLLSAAGMADNMQGTNVAAATAARDRVSRSEAAESAVAAGRNANDPPSRAEGFTL